MDDTTPASTAPAQPASDAPRRIVYRVRFLGDPAPYEVGKLWPQPDPQLLVARLTYEELRGQKAVADATTDEAREAATASLEALREALRTASSSDEVKAGSAPCYALVNSIHERPGDIDTDRPAMLWIVGTPFGPWAPSAQNPHGLSIDTEVPIRNAIEVTSLWRGDGLTASLEEHELDRLEREQSIECTECNAMNRPTHAFCSACGESLDEDEDEDDDGGGETPDEPTKDD